MTSSPPLEILLKRDRAVVVGGLAGITLLAWFYLVHLHRAMAMPMDMMDMPGIAMPMMQDWRPSDFLLTFVMWAVMMVGMMVPSVAPMVLTFATVNRRRAERGGPYVPAGIFLAGYLAAWTTFSFLATVAEWRLPPAAPPNAAAQNPAAPPPPRLLYAPRNFHLPPPP